MPFSHATSYSKLTDEQHQLIGMFVSEWAMAEFYLGLLLGKLLFSPDFLSRTYTDSLGAVQIQNAISQAVDIHKHRYDAKLVGTDTLEEIQTLNKRIEKLRVLRNKFAHFCWMRSSDQEIFGTNLSGAIPSGKRYKGSVATLKVDDIRLQYDDLYQVVERIKEITDGITEISEEAAIALFKMRRDGS